MHLISARLRLLLDVYPEHGGLEIGV
jgi:hypothetical protein